MIAPFLWQHRIIAPSAFAGYFSPIRRFEKLDVHKARLHFSNLASTKNLSTNALAEWCGAALFIILGIRNEKLGIGIAGSRNCHCEGASRPWQSREGTADLERLSLKWYVPIASVAAVTAQPLAALPPYGCGVPLAGNERPAGWQYLRHKFIGAMPSSLSLRGGRRPTWQSRSTRPDHRKAIGENAAAFPRLPRRFAPRNDKSGAVAILTMPCTSRRFTAGPGCPLPYSTPRSAGFFSLYHIPREKSTLSEKSGLSP